ncbi:TPA: ead/Ea22-like family protein [Enterobacter hormaechei]|nr:ead/Ea22-like family protein [Enterobacter hormaechei]HDR1945889.1 ead/Ea22-like family protein [Enterobacter hormaechei]
MSNIDKQALRERYSPQPVPKCHICGAEMTIQRMSASRITYGCTGATYDDAGCHYTVGRSIADDHYAQSRITVVDMSDPDVLALLDELEAAEKRIAELEAREVKLPELCVGVIQGGHAVMVPYAAGHWFNKTAILEMLADAGINIAAAGKGEAS